MLPVPESAAVLCSGLSLGLCMCLCPTELPRASRKWNWWSWLLHKAHGVGGSSLGAATLAAGDRRRRGRIPAPRYLVTARPHKEPLILRQSPATLRRAAWAGALSAGQARTRCPSLLQQPPNKILPAMGPLGRLANADAFRCCCLQGGGWGGPSTRVPFGLKHFCAVQCLLLGAPEAGAWGSPRDSLARAESTQEPLPPRGAAEGVSYSRA